MYNYSREFWIYPRVLWVMPRKYPNQMREQIQVAPFDMKELGSTPSSPSMFQLLIPSFTPFRPRWFIASANSQTTSSTVKELDLSQENWFKSDSEWKVIRGSLHHGLQQRSITNANWYNFKLALAPAKNHHWVCFGHKEVFKAYTAIQRNFISFQLLVPTNSFFLSLLRAREDRWGLERRLNVKSKAPNTRGNQA